MKETGDETFEKEMYKCKNMGDMRKKASKTDNFRTASLYSVAPVKVLLSQVFQRLELEGKSIKMSTAVAQTDIDALWQSLAAIEPNCPVSDQVSLMLSQVYKKLLIASIKLTLVYSKIVMNSLYVIFIIYLIINLK